MLSFPDAEEHHQTPCVTAYPWIQFWCTATNTLLWLVNLIGKTHEKPHFVNFLCQPHGFRASVDQIYREDNVNSAAKGPKERGLHECAL